jgi:hypothetical protein
MQFKFSDGTTLDVLAVKGSPTYFQGAQRDALEIQIGKSKTTFDALDKLTIIDGDKQYQHDNYSLRVSLALKPVVTAEAAADTPEQTDKAIQCKASPGRKP